MQYSHTVLVYTVVKMSTCLMHSPTTLRYLKYLTTVISFSLSFCPKDSCLKYQTKQKQTCRQVCVAKIYCQKLNTVFSNPATLMK